MPAVINGPMLNVSGPEMVTKVTRANGLGFMAAGKEYIGLGVQCFTVKLDDFVGLVKQHQPIAVLLFAAHKHKDDCGSWTKAIRAASDTNIWIQVDSVADTLILAEYVKPDVLVMQGVDAGGHGAAKAAGVISLVPETVDAIAAAGYDVPVIAAGGIADGRGIVAAVALGAVGVIMDTAFLASIQAKIHASYRRAILEAKDGGQSTFKHQIYDHAAGINWPSTNDARGLRNATTRDLVAGVSVQDNRKAFKEAARSYAGYGESIHESRADAWAGTGVGLIKYIRGAFGIVTESRHQAIDVLKRNADLF